MRSARCSKSIPTANAPKLTPVDVKLRLMASAAEPGKAYTLQEIADVVGVSRERVRQLEFAALRRLRKKMKKLMKDDNLNEEEFQR